MFQKVGASGGSGPRREQRRRRISRRHGGGVLRPSSPVQYQPEGQRHSHHHDEGSRHVH